MIWLNKKRYADIPQKNVTEIDKASVYFLNNL